MYQYQNLANRVYLVNVGEDKKEFEGKKGCIFALAHHFLLFNELVNNFFLEL